MGHEVVPDALGSFVRLPAGEPWTIGERAFDDGDGGKFAAAMSMVDWLCCRAFERRACSDAQQASAGRTMPLPTVPMQVIPLAEENSNEPQSHIRTARRRL
jgi:hypothetical protein